MDRLEANCPEHFFHRDLDAKPMEVDAWHDGPLCPWRENLMN